ncbi:MAG TPA: CDP-6-deoxy-delta-3,4-glucoseen reductase, partial [Gammaproteobacteria bacterium]|nr:CDP-6-deoxy-delta-3,4-glucoseen reductase [Gammaproteobacteria bacterium]
MPHKVRLDPSGGEFSVNSGETVLAAALRQGIHLPYGCRTGSCGTCRAHLISGEIAYPEGPPLALTVLERGYGEAVLCRAVPVTDLVVAAQEIAAMSALRVRAFPCRIARMEPLAHDVMAVYLKLPAVSRLGFLPGQYVDVLMADGHRRSFSLANPPHDDKLLELHVRHVPGGHFTTEVFEKLHEGALLRLQGPLGTFFLREDSTRPILMVAGGTGFAPIKAMLRHGWQQGLHREIRFYWGARARRDLYADELLRGWAASQPGFHYVPVLSEPRPEDDWSGRTGFVHEAVMSDYADLSGFDIYLSGPPPMVEAARQTFPVHGADPRRMFSDAFEFAPEVRDALEQAAR